MRVNLMMMLSNIEKIWWDGQLKATALVFNSNFRLQRFPICKCDWENLRLITDRRIRAHENLRYENRRN